MRKITNTHPGWIISVSKAVSNFFNPLISLLIYFIYFSNLYYTAPEAADRFLPALFIIILPVTAWIFWNVRSGRYSNMDVSDRKQRTTLYIFIEICIVAYLVYIWYVRDQWDWVIFHVLILLVLMQISNFFIKSSMHTAFNLLVAAFFFGEDMILGIIWVVITVLVGMTRIILKRHTIQEVVSGAAIALLVSFIYLYNHLQIQY